MNSHLTGRTLVLCGCLWTALAAVALAAEPKANALTPAELADGWISLFDGETLFGWQPASKADWKVGGGIVSVASGEPGLLATTSQFGDFSLKVDFRAPKGTNSGVFLRTVPQPKSPTADCYELNIADPENPFPTGSLVGRQKCQPAAATPQESGWQTFEVTAQGGHFLVRLNGKPAVDYTDPKPLGRGHIGLQLNQGRVEFRNIKLKPLGLASLFNGKDLAGWKVFPGKKSVFSVTPEGNLHVKNGNGQLESEAQFADFVFQAEIFSNGKALNSGIFFRSIPGEFWNGYESQIQNGYKDGDRTKPADAGTGAIYRRQSARKVVANDFEWFHKTIIATGNHMAVWINGYLVTDWTDRRAADANPRNGLRLEAGTLIIQGHDATTDLSFRNLRAAELPKR
ncbi:MAG: 3-keto-disaccharide hydrolase [Pirellulales bacterium]